MLSLTSTIDELVGGTTGAVVMDAWSRGWEAASPVREFPLGRRHEQLDAVTCPLCRSIDGRIMRRTDPRFLRWARGLHINCRGFWSWIGADQVGPDGKPTAPDWTDPDPDLIAKHGHFVAHPEKYAPLNVPARPTGRDVVFYRPARPEGGLERHVIGRWRDNLPDYAVRETLVDMTRGFADLADLRTIAGDAELAAQIIGHAAARQLFASPGALYAERSGAWADTAGTLTESEFAALPAAVMDHPASGLGTSTEADGSVRWFVYNPDLPLPAGKSLPDVALFYRPDAGAITDLARLP